MSLITPIAIAVIEHDGQFLVGQRPAGMPLAGLWEFPGGKIEPDELPAEAAVRECREEAGIEVAVVGSYPEHVQQYDHDRVRLHFLACRPINQEAIPLAPFRWVQREELGKLEFPAGNRALLQILVSNSLGPLQGSKRNRPPEGSDGLRILRARRRRTD